MFPTVVPEMAVDAFPRGLHHLWLKCHDGSGTKTRPPNMQEDLFIQGRLIGWTIDTRIFAWCRICVIQPAWCRFRPSKGFLRSEVQSPWDSRTSLQKHFLFGDLFWQEMKPGCCNLTVWIYQKLFNSVPFGTLFLKCGEKYSDSY